MAELARFSADPSALADLVAEATLSPSAGEPYYERLTLSLDRSGVATPVGPRSPSVHARYDPAYFEEFEVSRDCTAVLGTVPTLRWLAWLADDAVTVVFGGDPAEGIVERAEIQGTDHRIEADPLPTEASPDPLDRDPSTAFDATGRFAPDGEPAPTRVETDAATLERLVTAADIVQGEGIPVVVRDGEFRLTVAGEVMTGEGRLAAADVEGPDCRNWYGPELGAITRMIEGPVALEIVPNGPMAVVQESDVATRCYVLTQSM